MQLHRVDESEVKMAIGTRVPVPISPQTRHPALRHRRAGVGGYTGGVPAVPTLISRTPPSKAIKRRAGAAHLPVWAWNPRTPVCARRIGSARL
jgi:hypothetical protein